MKEEELTAKRIIPGIVLSVACECDGNQLAPSMLKRKTPGIGSAWVTSEG